MNLFSHNARPHPGPLPRGEGDGIHVGRNIERHRCSRGFLFVRMAAREQTNGVYQANQRRIIFPLLGERAGVRAVVPQTS